jgi:hypothetical protein
MCESCRPYVDSSSHSGGNRPITGPSQTYDSVKAIEEFAQLDAECCEEPEQRRQPDLPLAPFDARHLDDREARSRCKVFNIYGHLLPSVDAALADGLDGLYDTVDNVTVLAPAGRARTPKVA